ncbi:menaquinone-dependent succinate dehydrogenase/fumarate reductase, flavoprotein subunit [Mycobacteroides abscessus subsp. massiliense]|nr:menaquinone-dependent succinate dehydrogenase/fumarate reductase, flavoprotein subunit [Mycobacteroides abscessus subsp. massiliense]
MERTAEGLQKALALIPDLRREFWARVNVPGSGNDLNQSLERAGRVADFFELAELMVIDALHRAESAGGHFRAESQTADGEARRDDEHFSYVAAWEWNGDSGFPTLHKEVLEFEYVHPTTRSYK